MCNHGCIPAFVAIDWPYFRILECPPLEPHPLIVVLTYYQSNRPFCVVAAFLNVKAIKCACGCLPFVFSKNPFKKRDLSCLISLIKSYVLIQTDIQNLEAL